MKIGSILDLARTGLDDWVVPYHWDQSELMALYNRAHNEFASKTRIISDSSTEAIIRTKILSDTPQYALDPRVLEILGARIDSTPMPREIRNESWMDTWAWNWRKRTGTPLKYVVPYIESRQIRVSPYPDATYKLAGAANITFVAATKAIQKPSGLSIYAPGDALYISGTTSNNRFVTVVTATDAELIVSEAVVNEAGTSAVIRKVMDTLDMTVARMPLEDKTLADVDEEAEIPVAFHDRLHHGICAYAFQSPDSEKTDPKAAADHMAQFLALIEEGKKYKLRVRHAPSTLQPTRGTI